MTHRNSLAAKVYFYFSLFMIAAYLVSGFLIIFALKSLELQPVNRNAAGLVLILYAFYRMYKVLREKPLANEDHEHLYDQVLDKNFSSDDRQNETP